MIADSGASDEESPRVPSAFAAFAAAQPFALARYQREALAAMDEPGTSIVLVAPTGSGKSLVADAAIWSALQNGRGARFLVVEGTNQASAVRISTSAQAPAASITASRLRSLSKLVLERCESHPSTSTITRSIGNRTSTT